MCFQVLKRRLKAGNVLQRIHNLHLENITFGTTSMEIIKAHNKPRAWPAIVSYIAELLRFTKDKPNLFIVWEPPECNNGAFEIARSVVTDLCLPSYVAQGCLRWIKGFFSKRWHLLICRCVSLFLLLFMSSVFDYKNLFLSRYVPLFKPLVFEVYFLLINFRKKTYKFGRNGSKGCQNESWTHSVHVRFSWVRTIFLDSFNKRVI